MVTEGGPIQHSVSKTAQNLGDDPVFSVGGDLAFNWAYSNNGARIVLTGGRLSPADANDDNTHGLGNHFACNPLTGTPIPGNKNQSQNAKRASSQKRHMVISIFLLCNSLILMSIGAGSIRAIKGGLDKVFKIRDHLHRICRQILR